MLRILNTYSFTALLLIVGIAIFASRKINGKPVNGTEITAQSEITVWTLASFRRT